MVADCVAHLGRVHLEQRPVRRAAGGDHHVIDRCRQVPEEILQSSRVVDVEGRAAVRAHVLRRLREPVGIAAGEDHVGTLRPGTSSRLEPDACAAADHDDGLAAQFRFTLRRHGIAWAAGHTRAVTQS
jgi:hypothetical protein